MRLLIILFLLLITTDAFAGKEFARRFPSDTPMEVYTPNNLPYVLACDNTPTCYKAIQIIFDGATVTDLGGGVINVAYGAIATQYLLDPDGVNLTDPDANNLIWGS